MLYFWMGWEAWLACRNVFLTLEPCVDDPGWKDWFIPPVTAPAAPPYARCVHLTEGIPEPQVHIPNKRLAFAQDAQSRDLVLKVVNTDSDEYMAYDRLLQSLDYVDAATCVGILRPTAILHTPHNFCFIVMPRWGPVGGMRGLATVGEIAQFMRCTSKGLSFLHQHRIVHRDLCENNMVVNCYCPEVVYYRHLRPVLAQHRRSKDVHYCLIDFNISLCPPMDVSLTSYRHPSDEAWWGASLYHPQDVQRGEPEYNPFAYDVGSLGNLYRFWFWKAVPSVPLLAPLFDRMTTHILRERFTASEAAVFIDTIFSQLSDSVLETPVVLDPNPSCFRDSDTYWSLTPAHFIAEWALFRTPRGSWGAVLLDWFASTHLGWRMLEFVRRVLRI
ncbi:hypothetical protein FKP32DRAFT_1587848 [Trametes sanguinea]|nr:hypothetical protein FKP32DRAFT_1587848 [Trametes sanguinea]